MTNSITQSESDSISKEDNAFHFSEDMLREGARALANAEMQMMEESDPPYEEEEEAFFTELDSGRKELIYVDIVIFDGNCDRKSAEVIKLGYSAIPGPFIINDDVAAILSECLDRGNVRVMVTSSIVVSSKIMWSSNAHLTLISTYDILFIEKGKIFSSGDGSLILKAGIGGHYSNLHAKVSFYDQDTIQIFMKIGGGQVVIYYNPEQHTKSHKYYNSYGYWKHVRPESAVVEYMLINSYEDLKCICLFPDANYALSRHIDASDASKKPCCPTTQGIKLHGSFDGNNYVIRDLNINGHNHTGLFWNILGFESRHTHVTNLNIWNATVDGEHGVGALCGSAAYVDFNNVDVTIASIKGVAAVGGLCGFISHAHISNIEITKLVLSESHSSSSEAQGLCFGKVVGIAQNVTFEASYNTTEINTELVGCNYD